jgi:hypothetical protein
MRRSGTISVAATGKLNAAASLDPMRAKLVQAEAEWNRARAQCGSKPTAPVDYDTAKANDALAKASVVGRRRRRPL